MNRKHPKDQAKPADSAATKIDRVGPGRTPDSQPLTERDLDAVVGGAKSKKTKFPYVYAPLRT